MFFFFFKENIEQDVAGDTCNWRSLGTLPSLAELLFFSLSSRLHPFRSFRDVSGYEYVLLQCCNAGGETFVAGPVRITSRG